MKFQQNHTIGMVVLVLLSMHSCKQIRNVTDFIIQPTARDLYAREFNTIDTVRFNIWQNAYQKAKGDSLQIRLPYVEQGEHFTSRNVVYSYNVSLNEGGILHIVLDNKVSGFRSFIDVIKVNYDSSLTVARQNEIGENKLIVPIDETGTYRLLVQPELEAQGPFSLHIYSSPSFGFPVLGKDNKAIQSFWGALRAGGNRSHEGIDIFADRGTPVLAATPGRVTSTGEKGLGGKQVWLRTGVFGKSLYYAHLDSILVSTGKKVDLGDTLGFVGNTGNAKTTSPHLHFGIYKSGLGAIDPLPFVERTTIPTLSTMQNITKNVKISAKVANLRDTPNVHGLKLGETYQNDTLSLLGYTENWAHVKMQTGMKAFVHRSLIAMP